MEGLITLKSKKKAAPKYQFRPVRYGWGQKKLVDAINKKLNNAK